MAGAERIFINGRFLLQPTSGVQRYAREVVRALDRGPTGGDYLLLAPPGAEPMSLDAIQMRTIGRGGGHLWEQTALSGAARGRPLLSLGGSGPIVHRRQTVVIHDAAVFRHPEHFRPAYGRLHRSLGRLLSRRARIATVSEFSRRELSQCLRLFIGAITVAPNGADHFAGVEPDCGVLDRLSVRDRPIFVALGNLAPNKNLAVMMRALHRLANPEARLVFIGGLDRKVFGGAFEGDPRIILAGRLSDAETAALLRTARALIFASRYEGFGIPPLEAFANGCPVLASDIPAVREVCGDAPFYFAPDDDVRLAELMQRMIDQPVQAERMRLGLERVARYRWDATAAALDGLVRTSS